MTAKITVLINGEAVAAETGISVGSLLHARQKSFRRSPRLGEPRGLYCGMGVCFECMVDIDGQPARACITPVRDGMTVESKP